MLKQSASKIFHKKRLILFFLALGLLVLAWAFWRVKQTEKRAEEEKRMLIASFEQSRDSLLLQYLSFAAEVFSWSVRTELIRENKENLNQLLIAFVRASEARKVHIIDAENYRIILSTDKKEEGLTYTEPEQLQVDQISSVLLDSQHMIVVPVMEFSRKIAYLVVFIN